MLPSQGFPLTTCLRPPALGGDPGECQVGASSMSPPFWSGASSTLVQLCSQSNNTKGVAQEKLIANQTENFSLQDLLETGIEEKAPRRVSGVSSRSGSSTKMRRSLDETVTSTTPRVTFWKPFRY